MSRYEKTNDVEYQCSRGFGSIFTGANLSKTKTRICCRGSELLFLQARDSVGIRLYSPFGDVSLTCIACDLQMSLRLKFRRWTAMHRSILPLPKGIECKKSRECQKLGEFGSRENARNREAQVRSFRKGFIHRFHHLSTYITPRTDVE